MISHELWERYVDGQGSADADDEDWPCDGALTP